MGQLSIEELESVKCPPLNLSIERDLYFSEKPISEARPELKESLNDDGKQEKSRNAKIKTGISTGKENNYFGGDKSSGKVLRPHF